MKRISFGLTEEAFLAGLKDVTRRLGWLRAQAGDVYLAVDRVMGFKPGQEAVIHGPVEVLSVRREPLKAITQEDVRREGFPDWTPAEFVRFFCQAQPKVTPQTPVTRIEFRRVVVTAPRWAPREEIRNLERTNQAAPRSKACDCLAWAWTEDPDGLPDGRTWIGFRQWTALASCPTCEGDGLLPELPLVVFQAREVRRALTYADMGGRALHVWEPGEGGWPGAPAVFQRHKQWAHLIDHDRARLVAHARRLGVRVIKVGRDGKRGQHVDLCGGPLRRALQEAAAEAEARQEGLERPGLEEILAKPIQVSPFPNAEAEALERARSSRVEGGDRCVCGHLESVHVGHLMPRGLCSHRGCACESYRT